MNAAPSIMVVNICVTILLGHIIASAVMDTDYSVMGKIVKVNYCVNQCAQKNISVVILDIMHMARCSFNKIY